MAHITLLSGVAAVLILSSCFSQPAAAYFNKVSSETPSMSREERMKHRDSAKEMFFHAYNSYMNNAYPADELMPLSCQGRWRHNQPSRGDIDETLGNFSLTLIDSLDSLVILGELDEFERAVAMVIKDVSFDTDLVVSVFETNIRVVGGLLSAHILAEQIRDKSSTRLSWYKGQLLDMARDIGTRLLPAFNTSTGLPHSRVNLRHGVKVPQLQYSRETCTACAGTLLLEFAALSRLSGDSVFEEKAHAAMDRLWRERHRESQLVGTTINIHSGDWVRRDSGVGAGIDSYYEYCLKAYILLGDEKYLRRFNLHYQAVMKYISQGPLLLDVHMHKPDTVSRNFMDALLAFWPGLQVLNGDIKPAIETHEVLYQVMQRHNFLPEAFTTDFKVHWGQHLLRPEMIESTYMLHRATQDPYYLHVGVQILHSLTQYSRTECGFAAVKDVRTGQQEDRLDSFVLAETFKYLYLLFADESDLPVDINNYIFSTEAHLLPLSLSQTRVQYTGSATLKTNMTRHTADDTYTTRTCFNPHLVSNNFAERVRQPLSRIVETGVIVGSGRVSCGASVTNMAAGVKYTGARRLTAVQFDSQSVYHRTLLRKMGITVNVLDDGRIQFSHSSAASETDMDSAEGILFMQEINELSQQQQQRHSEGAASADSRAVSFLSPPLHDDSGQYSSDSDTVVLPAGPAQFGRDLSTSPPVSGKAILVDPEDGCGDVSDSVAPLLYNNIAVARRGGCMFVEKARRLQKLAVKGVIVIDDNVNTSANALPIFAMSGDGNESDIEIPVLFLYYNEGAVLLHAIEQTDILIVTMSDQIDKQHNNKGGVVSIDPSSTSHVNYQHNTPVLADSITKFGVWLAELLNLSSPSTEEIDNRIENNDEDKMTLSDRGGSVIMARGDSDGNSDDDDDIAVVENDDFS